jgi:transposase
MAGSYGSLASAKMGSPSDLNLDAAQSGGQNLGQPHRSSECPEWQVWVKGGRADRLTGASGVTPVPDASEQTPPLRLRASEQTRYRGRKRRGLAVSREDSNHADGQWKTTTFVAGFRATALTAPYVIDGPMNGNAFLAYVAQILAPSLKAGDIVVSDNLSAHKVPGVREVIEATGASLLYLPPYSSDFNPIEQLFAKLKNCCERLQSVPSTVYGTVSPACLTHSNPMNAQTTSATPGMHHDKWKVL